MQHRAEGMNTVTQAAARTTGIKMQLITNNARPDLFFSLSLLIKLKLNRKLVTRWAIQTLAAVNSNLLGFKEQHW